MDDMAKEVNERSIVTCHAKKRMRKRLGIPKKSAEKNAENALRYGVRHSQTKSSLRRYCDGIFLRGNIPSFNLRIYHRCVYIFDGSVLITVFPLPKKYHNVADGLERKMRTEDEENGGTK